MASAIAQRKVVTGEPSRIATGSSARRKIGGGDRTLYSQALLNRPGEWFEETLDAYLENPARAAPGTTMQYPGIPDAETRAAVIDFLKKLN